jgi:hypothetical protein
MADTPSEELRVRRLEELVKKLANGFEDFRHKLGQVAEDNSRDAKPLQGGQGVKLYHAQATTLIGPTVANRLGVGSANLLQVIEESGDFNRYQLDPVQNVAVLNDTGGQIPALTYLVVLFSEGKYTIVVADCATESPIAAPSPPSGG